MNDMYYGFKIRKTDAISNKYVIDDLANKEKIFDVKRKGQLKARITISDLDNNVVLEIGKIKSVGFLWNLIRDGKKIVDFKKVGNICSKKYEIETPKGSYLASKFNSITHCIYDNIGKEVVILKGDGRGLLPSYIVEVDETFDSLIALGVSLIFIAYMEGERAMKAGMKTSLLFP